MHALVVGADAQRQIVGDACADVTRAHDPRQPAESLPAQGTDQTEGSAPESVARRVVRRRESAGLGCGTGLTVLVTGAPGFVGRAVTTQLSARGHSVIGAGPEHSATIGWDALREPLPKVDWDSLDAIIHLAVPPRAAEFPDQAAANYELSIAATFRLLETARQHGIVRFLLASTGHVLQSSNVPHSEEDVRYCPINFYGTAKACAELLVRAYAGCLSAAVLRFYYPYGPGGDRFLVNRLLHLVAEGREISIEGDKGILLNPVWIEDLARGVALALESTDTGVFHFAGSETLTLRELLEMMGRLVGHEPVIRTTHASPPRRHDASFERSRRLLGYDPKISMKEGLRRLWTS